LLKALFTIFKCLSAIASSLLHGNLSGVELGRALQKCGIDGDVVPSPRMIG
jgi:hypothetical protein